MAQASRVSKGLHAMTRKEFRELVWRLLNTFEKPPTKRYLLKVATEQSRRYDEEVSRNSADWQRCYDEAYATNQAWFAAEAEAFRRKSPDANRG